MSKKEIISTDSAPSAIGTYSQAVKSGNTVYISGQIPLDPKSMEVVDESFEAAAHQVFKNLEAVASGRQVVEARPLDRRRSFTPRPHPLRGARLRSCTSKT